MTKINILGSTGIIGKKTLGIINSNFKNYKINFLMANNNYKFKEYTSLLSLRN